MFEKLIRLPRSLRSLAMTRAFTMAGGGQATPILGLMARRNDNSVNCHAELDSASDVVANRVKRKVGKIPNQVWNDNSPNGEGKAVNSHKNLVTWSPDHLVTSKSRKAAFTMADRLSRLYNGLTGLRSAFTMAEILLSLTIIGVVAAITLPSLTGNINERTWNTQRKALYSRLSQAIALMPAINGYGTAVKGTWENNYNDGTPATADLFLTNGLSKVLKLNNICDNNHLQDCGLPNKIMGTAGSVAFSAFPKTMFELTSALKLADAGMTSLIGNIGYDMKAAAFETANGESIAIYYNPNCRGKNDFKLETYAHNIMCANFIYDLNGKKGPNATGKDIGFMTLFYSIDSTLVAPVPIIDNSTQTYNFNDAQRYCRAKEDSRLPNFEEGISLFFNKELMGTWIYENIWTGTANSVGNRYVIQLQDGWVFADAYNQSWYVRCIKRN